MNESNTSFNKFNDWFNSQDYLDQAEFIENLNVGNVSDQFSEDEQDIFQEFKSLLRDVNRELRTTEPEKVAEDILNKGISDIRFIVEVIKVVEAELENFFSAKALREVDRDVFEYVVRTIIEDIIVFKKYRSIKRLKDQLPDQLTNDEVASMFQTVMRIVSSFCLDILSFDDVERVMKNDLEFTEEKINVLIDLLMQYREEIERFFLFFRLRQIRRDVNTLQFDVENMSY